MSEDATVRVIAENPMWIGGDEAYSHLPEDYKGPAKLTYEGHKGVEFAIFPDQDIANVAANLAIKPDLGGYTNVKVVMPEEGEEITHRSAQDWLFS